MKKRLIASVLIGLMLMTTGCGNSVTGQTTKEVSDFVSIEAPTFKEASVHDPSVVKVDGTYYVIGSHLAAAKTDDFMQWTQFSYGPEKGNPIFPDPQAEVGEALDWAETTTFWAGDIIQLADGRYYMYYCTCKGDSPRSYLGLAVSDNVEGPYEHVGEILRSGMWGEKGVDGRIYDGAYAPNAIDPHTFFDKEGRLWMTYGSYSGGIYIMEMNTETGFPLEDQGYGTKLIGGNHSRIEAPYILYSEETDYYYLFLSFGGLDAVGGYNIRVARSKTPDGPYLDADGNDMINCKGPNGSFFLDAAIEKYGTKLMGNFQFITGEGEAKKIRTGYVSPGHNSAYYEEETDQYFLIFHSRFTLRGEQHEIRVHQMFFNEEGWPVVAPHRYAGEVKGTYAQEDVVGPYKIINHGKDITSDIKQSTDIELHADGTITGSVEGTWTKHGESGITLEIDGEVFDGHFIHQWDNDINEQVMAFTTLSEKGVALWGSQRVIVKKD